GAVRSQHHAHLARRERGADVDQRPPPAVCLAHLPQEEPVDHAGTLGGFPALPRWTPLGKPSFVHALIAPAVRPARRAAGRRPPAPPPDGGGGRVRARPGRRRASPARPPPARRTAPRAAPPGARAGRWPPAVPRPWAGARTRSQRPPAPAPGSR